MAGKSKKARDIPATESNNTSVSLKKKKRGVISRIWNGLFRLHGDDFEKKLDHISKEEAAVLARVKKRSQSSRSIIRHLIALSVIFEVVAVGYAIMTTRSLELKWKMRAFRVLPMFIMPGLAYIIYSALIRFTRMCDRKDQKALDKLRAERQAIIDELKEKTNYYTTQQLIQRYDPDPAAKAAAATVLASKLGAESGLKVYVGDETKLSVPARKSNDVELVQSNGLRNRKELQTRYVNTLSDVLQHSDKDVKSTGNPVPDISEHNQLVVEHHHPGSTTHDGGWIARIAAFLVGEDPSESYALVCGHCRMHNGLARKEDFAFITYYCPRCNGLNRPKQGISSPNYPKVSSSTASGNPKPINTGSSTKSDQTPSRNSSVVSPVKTTEKRESIVQGESDPAN